MLNFPFFMNLLNFALKNDMPGDPFGKARDFILYTVNDIRDNGDVIFSETNRQVPFSLSPDEVVAMLHGSC